MQASMGGKQPRVLPSYDTCEPQQLPAWHDNPHGAVDSRKYNSLVGGLLNKREIMPGAGNPANCAGLEKSWILEQKLQLLA